MAWVLTATAFAQSTTVIPKSYAFQQGNFQTLLAADDRSYQRIQIGYGATLFARTIVVLNGLSFRGDPLHQQPALKARVSLHLSSSSRDTSQFAIWPADLSRNAGSDRALVFQGTIDLPQQKQLYTNKPFLVTLPFSRSFVFLPRRDKALVADLTTQVTQGKGYWHADTVTGVGSWKPGKYSQLACRFKDGNYMIGWVRRHDALVIGGKWGPLYRYHVPVGVAAMQFIGFTDLGHMWRGHRLGIAIPNAPGCAIAVGPELIQTFVTGPETQVPRLPIPYDRRLVAVTFYDQPIFFEKGANAAGIVTGPSSRWTIGDAPHGIVQTETTIQSRTQGGTAFGTVPITELR